MSLFRQPFLFLFSKNPYQISDMATLSAAKHHTQEILKNQVLLTLPDLFSEKQILRRW